MRDAGTRGRLALCRRPSDPVSLGHSGMRILFVSSATDNYPPFLASLSSSSVPTRDGDGQTKTCQVSVPAKSAMSSSS